MAINSNLLVYKFNNNLLFMSTEANTTQAIEDNNLLNQNIISARLKDLNQPKLGDIYFCQIIKFQKGLDCFFVDLGNNNFALLKYNKQTLKILPHPTIGQKFLGIITKEGNYSKYPVLSPNITLDGLLCNFKPFSDNITFCPELNLDINEKENIKKVIYSKFSNKLGLTIKKPLLSELITEISIKIQFWQQIINSIPSKIGLVYTSNILDVLYENSNKFPDNIVVNSLSYLKIIQEEITNFLPFINVNLIYNNTEIFLNYITQLEEQITNDYIVNEHIILHIYNTRALTFIDIDFKGTYNLNKEDALYKANILAANSIVKIIKLRNICGQIFIDALKVKKEANKTLLLNKYAETFKKFNIKAKILGFTKLGVLEIERSKKFNSINDSLFFECDKCNGSGTTISSKLLFIKAIMQIKQIINKNPLSKINVKGSQTMLEQFKKHNQEIIVSFNPDTLNFIIDNNIINNIIVY